MQTVTHPDENRELIRLLFVLLFLLARMVLDESSYQAYAMMAHSPPDELIPYSSRLAAQNDMNAARGFVDQVELP